MTQPTTQPMTQRSVHEPCNETRSTRLHYQLRCLRPAGHDGAHAWTPELLPAEDVRASA